MKEKIMEALKDNFRPEFLNRLDEILLFSRLGREVMTGIVDIQLGYLYKLLVDRRIKLDVDDKAKKWLADQGYDPAYGARPLKRVIQTNLQNRMAEMILRGEILDGSSVQVSEKGGALDFKVQSPKAEPAKKAA